jgi:hypothetical protein
MPCNICLDRSECDAYGALITPGKLVDEETYRTEQGTDLEVGMRFL